MAGNRRWTGSELETLKNKYGNVPIEILSKELRRSINSIQKKANDMGYSFAKEKPENVLTAFDVVIKKLDEINRRLIFLEESFKKSNIYKSEWSKEEIDFVIKNHETMTNREISEVINRTVNNISQKKHVLGLSSRKNNKLASIPPNKIKFIKKNYKQLKYKELANKTNLSLNKVNGIIHSLISKGEIEKKHKRVR